MRNFESAGRSAVYGANGMVATSHPRASMAALDVLRGGGNAIDAAIAAAAVLTVVEPHMTGIGGDGFALYAPAGGEVVAYNGSGRAAAAAGTQYYLDNGITEIAPDSPHAVTIPGVVDLWARLVDDHGTRELGDLLSSAIDLAENGCPLQPRVAFDWARWQDKLNVNPACRAQFTKDGKVPGAGEVFRNPRLAATLREIAAKGRDGFYKGRVADDLVASLRELGGLHTADDFAAAGGDYVTPIGTGYRGYDVLECPPNGQGFIALIMLNILEGYDLSALDPDSAARLHLEIEAARLAYTDRDRFFANTDRSPEGLQNYLSKDYAARRRAMIDPARAMADPDGGVLPAQSDTVYLCVVDRDANAVSFINSIFRAFGSGIVCPRTGVVFQDRGSSFTVDPAHGNTIEGGKRPSHTIMPAMLVKDGRAVMPFGVMGGQYQPFGQVHVLTNMLDHGLDVQQALESPRLFHQNGKVEAEGGISAEVQRELAAMGHEIIPAPGPHGGGQAIQIDWARGVFTGGSDPRKDGVALGF